MSSLHQNRVGQVERVTQNRVVGWLQKRLGYRYLGDWSDKPGNANIEVEILTAWLRKQTLNGQPRYSDALIAKAIEQIRRELGGITAGSDSLRLYERNRRFYGLLRYGVKVKVGIGEHTETVWLVDWNPRNVLSNDFAFAEEVTLNYKAENQSSNEKRPDIVFYVNGLALGVLELKRSSISVGAGIRQNIDNQKSFFIAPFFETMQLVMAGSDSEGLRYGTVGTSENFYLEWKEDAPASDAQSNAQSVQNPLDRALLEMMEKGRFLELIHDFVVFDAGIKKLPRPHQYFGVRAAHEFARRGENGIIWHTQGSGKSLTMVWLAKWLKENIEDARVLIVTDRTELDEQIERVFEGVNEKFYRTKSGADLLQKLGDTSPSILGSLVHKFGGEDDEKDSGEGAARYARELESALRAGFKAHGKFFVFVDECHRTQTGKLHDSMKAILPDAAFFGFTGTPLLKADKRKSVEVFGRFIHEYKYNQAVRDKVVLDLRYEARSVEQNLESQEEVDEWFEDNTQGLTEIAKAQLKKQWGTMRSIFSSKERLTKIARDIWRDMTRPGRLKSGHGNAILVAESIYQATRYYEIFCELGLKGKCAVVTSYEPNANQIKGEGDQHTQAIQQFGSYRKMLEEWFPGDPNASQKVAEFERGVKEAFVKHPAQMKLLIVVDKLLTGFDAPSATYLYIDKPMRDHGLFQAICRVNRLDDETKEYGYIVDYRDLFGHIRDSMRDYTSAALSGYDPADVKGLLSDRLQKGRERLEELLTGLNALREPVKAPRNQDDYRLYFCGENPTDPLTASATQRQRLMLYTQVASLVRAYADLAPEMEAAGYSPAEAVKKAGEVKFFTQLRDAVKLASGDAIDLKFYEAGMRNLIDSYVDAKASQKLSAFEDLTLLELIARDGVDAAIDALPDSIKNSQQAVAETIANNVRRLIVNESPINPAFYDRLSKQLEALLAQLNQKHIDYKQYLDSVAQLARAAQSQQDETTTFPATVDTAGLRALYENLDGNEDLALKIHRAVKAKAQADWRLHPGSLKHKAVEREIKRALGEGSEGAQGNDKTAEVLALVTNQPEY